MYGRKFDVPKLRKHQLSDADIVRLAKGLGSTRSRDTQGKNRVSWLHTSGRTNMKAGILGSIDPHLKFTEPPVPRSQRNPFLWRCPLSQRGRDTLIGKKRK